MNGTINLSVSLIFGLITHAVNGYMEKAKMGFFDDAVPGGRHWQVYQCGDVKGLLVAAGEGSC